MSIQIITGFSLNGSEPIDTRIVASGSSERDAITYKYQGLRVFDLSDNKPYVYIGATWSEEGNANQVLGLSGSVARFTSNNSVGSSNIYQLGSNVGINSTNPLASVQFGPTTSSSLPFVIHKGGGLAGTIYVDSTVLAHNWYYTGAESYFNSLVGSSKLIFGSFGDIHFQNKAGGPGNFIQSIYISPSGRVGIGSGFAISSQPGSALVVNGTITGTFSGNGSGVTNINPNNITNQNLLSAGSSVTASNVVVANTTTNATHYLTFVSSGSWASTLGSSTIRANISGISYNPSTNILNTGRINYSGGALASTAASRVTFVNLTSTAGSNIANLEFNNVRNTAGTDWLTSGYRIQSRVDAEYLSYIQFNGTNNDAGISIGTGYMATNSTSNSNERLRISSAGLLTVNGTMRHVSPTFSSLGSFSVGTGTLARTTQINIASAAFDRVIYVYSNSNSNFYYSTGGFFEIEIYIINGVINQQIYTIFHQSDSDIRPTGVGYNYILPAGLTSTISLYKSGLTWNAGTGPTIFATSLKFGI